MSVDRSTHAIVTPVGAAKILLKDWITGREKQLIDGALYGGMETEGEGAKAKPKMGRTMIADQENASIEAVIVSINNNESNIVETVLDMHSKDYEFIVKHIDKIVKGDFDPKEENDSKTNITNSSEEPAEESKTLASI